MPGARILVVEDDAIIAYCLRETLSESGYDVVGPVPSGEEAIQKAAKESPDLVLMDINLAGELNGIEAAVQIQARSDILVIYFTGYAEDVLQQEAGITEPYACLSKPVHERELCATIEMMLDQHEVEKRGADEHNLQG
jgi:CheY-like chemotaxis protein